MRRLLSISSFLVLQLAFLGQARSDLVNWQIDSNSSWIRLSIPDQNIQVGPGQFLPAWLRDQGADPSSPVAGSWTDGGKRLATVGGTLSSDYDEGNSIQFNTGTHTSEAVESGVFRPDRTTWDGSNFDTSQPGTPAAFAADLTLQGAARLAFINIYNVNLDTDGTASLSGGGGTWTGAGALTVGALAGSILDLDGIPSVITLTDSLTTLAALQGVTNLGSNGALSINDLGGFNRELILSHDVPFIVFINGLPLNATFETRIRATAVIPEPASIALVGIGICLAGCRRRRIHV